MESSRRGRRLLVQAPVPPVDVDGIVVVSIGTVLFGIAAVVLVVVEPAALDLRIGRDWFSANRDWPGVAISGFVLGVLGLAYCVNRRRLRARR